MVNVGHSMLCIALLEEHLVRAETDQVTDDFRLQRLDCSTLRSVSLAELDECDVDRSGDLEARDAHTVVHHLVWRLSV